MTLFLIILFFATALLYASVGFGGGSTYNALLVLHGADYRILPSIALLCNIVVVAGGAYRFWRAGHVAFRRLAPFVAFSIPAAWIGGRIPISETVFIGVLGFSLLAAGLQLAFERNNGDDAAAATAPPLAVAGAVGAGIGFISGLAGIGGGIFLAPVLYFLRWGAAREIAGACSIFILVNSLSGLAGQMVKLGDTQILSDLVPYWPLLPAVLIGGQIGSRLAISALSPAVIKKMTAVLIIYVAARLLLRWGGVVF